MTANQTLSRPESPSPSGDSTHGARSTAVYGNTARGQTVPQHSVDVTEVLDLLGDEYVCSLLRELDGEPMAARELAEACGMSRATVYRRLDRLTSAGLVEATMSLATDGHHRRRFSLVVDELEIRIGEDGLDGSLRIEPQSTTASD